MSEPPNETLNETVRHSETLETHADTPENNEEPTKTYRYSELIPSHQRFVDAYRLQRNAARAARKAGFSPNGAAASGARLLRRDDIQYVLNNPNNDLPEQGVMTEEQFDALLTAFARGQGQQALPALKLLGERRGWVKKQQDEVKELPMPFASDRAE